MTDNEIIKALECCIDFVSGGESMCNECPLHDYDNCSSEQRKQALDLIKHQKAEVERLKEELDGETVKNMRLGHKIEQWKEEANRYQNLWCEAMKDIQTAKSEAIKEYKEKVKSILISKGLYLVVVKNALNEVEKKMTEDREKCQNM